MFCWFNNCMRSWISTAAVQIQPSLESDPNCCGHIGVRLLGMKLSGVVCLDAWDVCSTEILMNRGNKMS